MYSSTSQQLKFLKCQRNWTVVVVCLFLYHFCILFYTSTRCTVKKYKYHFSLSIQATTVKQTHFLHPFLSIVLVYSNDYFDFDYVNRNRHDDKTVVNILRMSALALKSCVRFMWATFAFCKMYFYKNVPFKNTIQLLLKFAKLQNGRSFAISIICT